MFRGDYDHRHHAVKRGAPSWCRAIPQKRRLPDGPGSSVEVGPSVVTRFESGTFGRAGRVGNRLRTGHRDTFRQCWLDTWIRDCRQLWPWLLARVDLQVFDIADLD